MEKLNIAKNGVRVYSYKNPMQNGFFISLFLKSGSMYEGDGELGITHFLEHILVRNVNKISDMKLYSTLDRYGLEFNASTYSEMVQFYLSGASKNFRVAAEAVSKLFEPIILTKSEIDSERRRIKAEIRENDDKNSMSSFAMSEVYEGTPLKNSITGTHKSVDRITGKRLEDYRKRAFTEKNIFFFVNGNFSDSDIEYLCDTVGKYELLKGEQNHENLAPVPQKFGKRGAKVSVKNGEYTMVRFNFDLDMKTLSSPVIDLIYDNLFAGYSSPFFIKMSEEQGLFYDISGSTERYRNIGTLYFSFEVKERDIYEAVKTSVDIIKSFKSETLSAENCMKAGYTDNAGLLLDDTREMNFTFAYDAHIMSLGYKTLEERKAAYEKITPEQVRLGACQIFTPDNLVLTVKGNKKKIDTARLSELISAL